MEETLFIIKPDALCENQTGLIIEQILQGGFKIIGMKMLRMDRAKASRFYAEHRRKDFYRPLVDFMSSNPVIVMVLRRNSAIKKLRELVGATNPSRAEKGTIRRRFARDGRHNAVHASDSPESAKREILFFFKESGINGWKYKNYPVVKMS
ncbi:MAG: nucleoside-diphosphate kinase [bacterium]